MCVGGEGMALVTALNATISSSVQITVHVKFRLIREHVDREIADDIITPSTII